MNDTYQTQRTMHAWPRGLTVLEVLFAMAVLLIGLIGVAAMIPLAGRQAESSVSITQSLAVGDNALQIFKAQSVAHPRMDSPWLIVDDIDYGSTGFSGETDSQNTWYPSFRRMYVGRCKQLVNLFLPKTVASGAELNTAKLNLAILQNQLTGTAFCIDPLFWSVQTRYGTPWLQKNANAGISPPTKGSFRRARFPFYDEEMPLSLDPLDVPDLTKGIFVTPRMVRVSLLDPNGADVRGNNGWLRFPAATQLASVNGGDVVMATPESDRSVGPLRGSSIGPLTFDAGGNITGGGNLIASSALGSNISWMATLVPSDDNSFIDVSTLNVRMDAGGNVTYPDLNQFPANFELAMVVFSRRDVRESIDGSSELRPKSERLFQLTGMGPDGMSSGTFDITFSGSEWVDDRVRVGDWLMLSRSMLEHAEFGRPIRDRHKWYRVISVSGDESELPRNKDLPVGTPPPSRTVRLAGSPWGWTKAETNEIISQVNQGTPGISLTDLVDVTKLPPTSVTLLSNVVQVYQRTIVPNID